MNKSLEEDPLRYSQLEERFKYIHSFSFSPGLHTLFHHTVSQQLESTFEILTPKRASLSYTYSQKPFSLYGKLYQNCLFDISASYRPHRPWLLRLSLDRTTPQCYYRRDHGNTCSEFLIQAPKTLLMNTLHQLFPGWYFGSEMIVQFAEKNVGASLGLLRETKHDQFMILASPFIGYLSLSQLSWLSQRCKVATCYTMNVFSYESDLSLGMQYFSKTKDQNVRLRWSPLKGFGLALETQLQEHCSVVFSLESDLSQKGQSQVGLEFEVKL